jgi:hypothetical protein
VPKLMPRAPMPSTGDVADEIKSRITIPILAAKLSPGWQKARQGNSRSPLRTDSNPSFSIRDNDTRFKDFGSGDGGDVFDLYMAATKCGRKEAFLALKGMVLGGDMQPIYQAARAVPEEKKPQFHPELSAPTDSDLQEICRRRGIRVDALRIAVERGFLHASILKGERAFVVTDNTRKNYRARRLDGNVWEHTGGKAFALSGSQASWPIGVCGVDTFPAISLCEAEMDFLSAFDLAESSGVSQLVAPVCMSGSAFNIPPDALPLFKDKRVRIFVHDDAAGYAAGKKWFQQLKGIASKVDGFSFGGLLRCDGSPATDLNDLLLVDQTLNQDLITTAMNFAERKQ